MIKISSKKFPMKVGVPARNALFVCPQMYKKLRHLILLHDFYKNIKYLFTIQIYYNIYAKI